MAADTVKNFVSDSYQLVSANSPTVTLPNGDLSMGLRILNRLINSYSGTGLLTTIAQEVVFQIAIGQEFITFADASFTPPADVQIGRLSNLQNAWLELDGVTYPLTITDRNVFYGSYKFDPQQGLPRFVIIQNQNNVTQMRVYPSASQVYNVHVYGKFQPPVLTINGDMSSTPDYWQLFLQYALAKNIAYAKGRASAWTKDLEDYLKMLTDDMISVSSINLDIQSDEDSMLNGSWRVRAGI